MPLRHVPVLLFALLVGLEVLPLSSSAWTLLTPTAAHAQVSGSPLKPVSLPHPSPVPEAGSTKKDNKKDDKKKTSPFTLVMGLLAGLALFLFGVEQMARGFRAVAGDNIKTWLERFTKNRFAAVGTGAVATTVLDSSSVTIILLITLIQADLISFSNSLGVVLGANIGTAVGSQLIAFDLHKYAPVGIAAGFLLHVAGRSDRQKEIGLILLGLGMLFFGLGYLGDAMEPFKENKAFTDWMAALGKNPLLGALAGCVFTLVIQSSSATVGVAITMAATGLIGLPAGIAIMLGAEIGTVSDTIIASIGRGREAMRTAAFHLLFNVITVTLGLVFVSQLTAVAKAMPGTGIGRDIANAHILFNTLGVVLFIGFLGQIAALLERLIPPGSATPGDEPNAEGKAELNPQAYRTANKRSVP